MKRTTFFSAPRLAWGLVLLALVSLLALAFSSPKVVNALRRLFGYVPGVGVIDQSAPLRVLAEPVSVSRDGLTITVKDAVVSADKTTLVLSMEMDGQSWGPCLTFNELDLPDGQVYKADPASNIGDGTEGMRLMYAPLPADIDEAALLALPCLRPTTPGAIPEKWEFHLRFIPAPPDMTVMPAVEITPSPAPVSSTDMPVENPLSIAKMIDADDEYILIGEFTPPAPSQTGNWSSQQVGIKLSDANGQEVPYDIPQDIELPAPGAPHAETWAIKFARGFSPPLRISYSNQYVLPAPSQPTIDFEFDAGPNPNIGQVFNQEIKLAGHLTQVSIHVTARGYFFDFICLDGAISGAKVEIPGYTMTSNGGGGEVGGGGVSPSGWSAWMDYSEMPKGKVTVILSNIWIYGDVKTWTIDWQP